LTQNTFQTIQQVLMVLNWAVDLAGIADGVEGGGAGFAEDLAMLASLAGDVSGIAWDIEQLNTQLNTLLSLYEAPTNTTALQQHAFQMRRMIVQGYSYAMRVQTLIGTTLHTVQHIVRVTGKIAAIAGGVSGQQNGQEYLAKLTQVQSQQQVITAAFARAQSVQQINEPLTLEALELIKLNVRVDMPK
jgi:hypothetical protein